MSQFSQKTISTKGLFLTNSEQRTPCILLLDRSSSMEGAKIAALNRALPAFIDAVKSDPLAAKRVELTIVSYGSTVTQDVPFSTIDRVANPPTLIADGDTPMGAAIVEAFRLIKERQDLYRSALIPSHAPWILCLTDGEATDDLSQAKKLIDAAEKNAKGIFYAVGVEGADMDALKTLSVRPPLELDGLVFKDLFLWLSASLGMHSRSPGTKPPAEPARHLSKKADKQTTRGVAR